MCVYCDIRVSAMNRTRERLFGDQVLAVYETTPADGETSAGEFASDWTGQRVEPTTNAIAVDAGAWQFQIKAEADWATSQDFMLRVVALTVGSRRWKVKKVEKPVDDHGLVWKILAQIQ